MWNFIFEDVIRRMVMSNEYLFVYGTLRKAKAAAMHRVLARHSTYCSDAEMQGRLYEINGYPGAIASGNREDKVYGELYRLKGRDTVLRQLDEYEGCADHFPAPHEYVRKKVSVILPDGERVPAWVYLYNCNVSRRLRIRSGDYMQFLHRE